MTPPPPRRCGRCPSRTCARAHCRSVRSARSPTANRSQVMGLPHGGEIAYVFNSPRGAPFDPEGASISKAANAYWVAFAKTGNPDSAGGPLWPKFDAGNEALMEFGPQGAPHV